MTSDVRTEFAEGTVEYKPDPQDRDGKDGPWIAYQIKVGDAYYDCNKKVYDAVNKDEAIKFTYSTRHFTYKSGAKAGQEGKAYKISDLIGPATLHDTVQPSQTPSTPPTEAPRIGMIGSLPGAEIGAMENRATQIAVQMGMVGVETIKGLLMDQALLGSWFKAQQIPSADESEIIPLQDNPQFDDPIPLSQRQTAEPDWSDGPDPIDELRV